MNEYVFIHYVRMPSMSHSYYNSDNAMYVADYQLFIVLVKLYLFDEVPWE